MNPNEPEPPGTGALPASQDRVLFGGLLATCVGFLAQLCDKTPERFSLLWWTTICFATAMPILSTCLLLDMARLQPQSKPIWRLLFDAIGVLASVVAVALVFVSVNPWAGGVFFGTTVLAIFVARASKR